MEIFEEMILHSWQHGVPRSPVAFKTLFGWVLAGCTGSCAPAQIVAAHHTTLLSGDDLV